MGATNAYAGYAATGAGYITFIENGWLGEGFAIHMTDLAAISGCPAPGYEFGISADHPAYKILVALMINAFSQHTQVQLVVDQGVCVLGNRTKIISIRSLSSE